jgi:CheY-like chemotaxis protein
MIVDNDSTYLELLSEVLRLHGYDVLCAGDGEEALARLRKDAVDLVISDISMPKMNGISLHRYMRRDETLRRVPFAWNSAYRELRSVVEVQNRNLDINLSKGTPLPKLLTFLKELSSRTGCDVVDDQ